MSANAFALAMGVGLHLLVFRSGEWDAEAARILKTALLCDAAATVALRLLVPDHSLFEAGRDVLQLTLMTVLGIYASMLIYRAFFHRLHRFPGPFLARLSNLYPTYVSAKQCHLHEEVERLHHRYGDVVRFGPSELSVASPEAFTAIHSAQSLCTKGPWYTVNSPSVSLQMCRNRTEHAQRRKVWDHAFSTRALRDYEPRVAGYTEKLLKAIEQSNGKPMNASKWFNFYSFDVMGELSFGNSFGLLDDGSQPYFMTMIHKRMDTVGFFSHMIWLFQLSKQTPGLNKGYQQFAGWVAKQVQARRKMTLERPDIFSWILEDFESKPAPSLQDQYNIMGDAVLISVAGSDTTSSTLSCLFFELANHREVQKVLQSEIDEHYAEHGSFESAALSKLSYLEAVINETLRLHPAVPSGLQRETPTAGLQVGDYYIPGNTIVQVPIHTIMRDSRNFEAPAEFVPERWTTKKGMVRNAKNFVPFSIGSYSCVGKQLALMELRCVSANILHRFDVALAPGQTKDAFMEGKRDTFTLGLPPLNVLFTPRKADNHD